MLVVFICCLLLPYPLLPFLLLPSSSLLFPLLLSMASNGAPAYRWFKVKSEAGLSKPHDSESACSQPRPTFPCSRCSRRLAHPFTHFLPGNKQPTHLSSVLTSVRISMTRPLSSYFQAEVQLITTSEFPQLLRSFYGSAYLILFEDRAWVLIYLCYLSPDPTLTQSPACVGTQ